MIRGMTLHWLAAAARGLELHAWQEQQLAALQGELKDIDVIALHVKALRCGRALMFSAVENGDAAQFTTGHEGFSTSLRHHSKFLLVRLAPHGDIERWFGPRIADLRKMIGSFTPADGILRPADLKQASAWWGRAKQGTPAILWAQALVNEGQIACALERYRLTHQQYPETLDALVPSYIERLPGDFINGEPLKYRRAEDGNFLLYSVGWNETDDGGKAVADPAHPESLKEGDWVWRNLSSPQ